MWPRVIRVTQLRPALYFWSFFQLTICAAWASTVEIGEISLEIPTEWTVEDNKHGTVVATGNEIADKMPAPFFTAGYCDSTASETSYQFAKCEIPCSPEAMRLPDDPSGEAKWKVGRHDNGAIQHFDASISAPDNRTRTFVHLACKDQLQIRLLLLTNGNYLAPESAMEKIVASIKWKR